MLSVVCGCVSQVNTLAHVAATLRMQLRINKYVLWAGLALGLRMLRPSLVLKDGDPMMPHVAAWLASTGAVLYMGVKKVQKAYAAEALAAKAETKAE